MKKIIANILIVALLFFGVGSTFAVPKVAYAACSIGGAIVSGNGLLDCVNDFVVGGVMPIIGKFLQLTAYLFDHAITLNMNIAQFIQKCDTAECAISPVEVVWKLIRDVSGMFFIFVLIWSSVKMILSGENNKSVIVGVVMAGLLVNFSLFATKIVIDASNSLTLTIYNAITPNYNPTIKQSLGFGAKDINRQIPGSISSKIMQVVDLQSLYANTTTSAKKTNFNVTSIVATVGGISLMLVLGIAFLSAGLMFLWRFIMLLVLMAFSPLPALAMAFPQLRDKSKAFTGALLNQCLFAPIFLFFLYIAMKVMTDPSFIALSNPDKSTFAATFAAGGNIAPLIQFGLVIFIIFMGLLAAKSFGAKGADFGINGMKWLGKSATGFAGRNTIGLVSKDLGKGFDRLESRVANSPLKFLANNGITRGISGGLKTGANAKFGGSQNLEDIEKAGKERGKKLREVQLASDLKSAANKNDEVKVKAALDKMTDAEIAKLDKDTLTKSVVMRNISKGVHSAIDKGDKSDAHKMAISDARSKEFADVISKADPAIPSTMKALKSMTESFDKEEYTKIAELAITNATKVTTPMPDVIKRLLKKLDGEAIADMNVSLLTDPVVAKHFTSEQLKKMEFLGKPIRASIGAIIRGDIANVGHKYVTDNIGTW